MSNARQCPKCGGELPADPSMEGLCPRCLLVLGLGADEANREKIGGYEVLSELGRGGMGVVYKAYQVSLNRIVALKVLSEHIAQDKAFVRRFEREARSAAQLNHPNVVTIHDIGCEGDTHFIAMECVEGRTISQLLEEHGQLDVALALRITQQVLKALAAAHERGIIHRDIKARNVLIDDADCVKVADFGLAKSVEDTAEITNTGALLGTPAYMSPEQCMGETVDPRTDLYGVGVLLYHMLAGRVPFAGKTPAEVFHKTVHESVPAIHQFNSDVPDAVWRIMQRALAKEASNRYSSAPEMSDAVSFALEQCGAGNVRAQHTRKPNHMKSFVKHLPKVSRRAMALCVCTVSLVALALVAKDQFWNSRQFTDPALEAAVRETLQIDRPPTPDELLSMTELRVDQGITDLSGIGACENLIAIGLGTQSGDPNRNRITTLEPLHGLDRLKELDVFCNPVTDGGLRVLRGLPQLETLFVGGCGSYSEAGIEHVSTLSKLRCLGISDMAATDEALAFVLQLDALEELYIGGSGTRGKILEGLAEANRLKKLAVNHTAYLNENKEPLQAVARMTGLEYLDVSGLTLSNDDLATLAPLVNLELLDLGTNALTDEGLKHLTAFTRLKTLRLIENDVSAQGVGELQRSLPDCEIEWDGTVEVAFSDANLEQAIRATLNLGDQKLTRQRLLALTDLDVQNRGINSLDGLEYCTNLRNVSLASDPAKEPRNHVHDLTPIAELRSLRFLGLSGLPLTDKSLRALSGLTELDTLQLGWDIPITDVGLTHIEDLTRLTGLDLNGAPVTDEGLQFVLNIEKLHHLNIAGTKITGAILEGLKQAPTLRELCINHVDALRENHEPLQALTALANLEYLTIGGLELHDGELGFLEPLVNLEYLDLSDSPITDEGLAQLSHLKNLTGLQLRDTQVAEAGLRQLQTSLPNCEIEWDGVVEVIFPDANLEKAIRSAMKLDTEKLTQQRLLALTELDVPNHGIANLVGMEACSNLVDLNLYAEDGHASPNRITDLSPLQRLRRLKTLNVYGNRVSDEALGCLAGLQNIENLLIGGHGTISDTGIAYLGGLSRLTNLCVDGTRTTDEGLDFVLALEDLKCLHLGGAYIEGRLLEKLAARNRLTFLTINDTDYLRKHKEPFQSVARMTKLEYLDVGGLSLGDEDLGFLKDLQNLKTLLFHRNSISDNGLDAFRALSNLRRLDLRGNEVTDEGVRELHAHLADCEIQWSGGTLAAQESASAESHAEEVVLPNSGHDKDTRNALNLPDQELTWQRLLVDPALQARSVRTLGLGTILGVAWSGDGNRIASAGGIGVALWNAEDASMHRVLEKDGFSAQCVAFSPDNAAVLAGGRGGTAVIWDAATGRELLVLDAHSENRVRYNRQVLAVGFSPDGNRILTAGMDGRAYVWDAKNGEKLSALIGHESPVTCAAFSSEGSHVITAGADKSLRVWTASKGELVTTLRGHSGVVECLAVAPRANHVVSGGHDNRIQLWHLSADDPRACSISTAQSVAAIAVSPDGEMIACGDWGGTVALYAAGDLSLVRRLPQHAGIVRGLAFSPDGGKLLTADLDGNLRTWMCSDGTLAQTYQGHTAQVRDACLSFSSGTILTAPHTGTLRMWDIADARIRWQVEGRGPCASSVDGKLVLTHTTTGALTALDANTGETGRILGDLGSGVYAISLSRDGRFGLIGKKDGTAEVWDVRSGLHCTTFRGHQSAVGAVAFSPDGALALTGSADGIACLWETEGGRLMHRLEGHSGQISCAAFSADGETVLTGSRDTTLRLWDRNTGQTKSVLSGHTDSVSCAVYSNDGSLIASTCWDGNVKIWATDPAMEVATFRAHNSPCTWAQFRADDSQLVTAGYRWPRPILETERHYLSRHRRESNGSLLGAG